MGYGGASQITNILLPVVQITPRDLGARPKSPERGFGISRRGELTPKPSYNKSGRAWNPKVIPKGLARITG